MFLSTGLQPVSVTIHHDPVYVLNAGSDNVSGFWLRPHGKLAPIAGSTRPLSGTATGPAQMQFSPDGRVLVVTEKATNLIITYAVDDDGLLGSPQAQTSQGATPFDSLSAIGVNSSSARPPGVPRTRAP